MIDTMTDRPASRPPSTSNPCCGPADAPVIPFSDKTLPFTPRGRCSAVMLKHLVALLLLSAALTSAPARAQTPPTGAPTGTVVDICDRTQQVQNTILDAINPRPGNCANVPAAELRVVRSLDLRDQGISALQSGDFAGLSRLESLDLAENQLSALPGGIFAGLSGLESLDLAENRFNELPGGIFAGLSGLESLNLAENRLSELSVGIFADLSGLESLNLAENQFSALPVGIFAGLSGLESLNLAENRLGALLVGIFAGLSGLESLNLTENQLSVLPVGIFAGLSELESLDLAKNRLSALLVGIFVGLSGLESLDLAENRLSALPVGIFVDLSGLESLDLAENRLRELPVGIFVGLSGLESLDLAENRLRELPVGIFADLSGLVSLYLDGNLFTQRPGLPVGIFDGVLDTLDPITTTGEAPGFRVDEAVRAAHFVCSRLDAAAIVTFADVDDCLLVNARQFNAYLAPMDATLSGLTISPGTLAPVFDPATTTYTVTVLNNVTAVTVTPTAQAGATITVNTNPVGNGNSSAYILLPTPGTAVQITIEVTAVDDENQETYTLIVTRMAAPPSITNIELTSNVGDGGYAIGDAIEATVTFSEAVTVTNQPQLALTVGTETRQAVYASGSSTATALVFSYTVVADDRDDDGVEVVRNALTANNGTIRDAAGNAALLDHAAITADVAHRVDTAAPTVSAATINGTALTLTYNEALDASSAPAPAAWTLTLKSGAVSTVNTGGMTIRDVTISGATVTLTLRAAVALSDDVTLAYTAGANPLRDLAGNNAANLTTQAVVNGTPSPGAALTSTLTEADLFAPTAPTVTVTLANTEYVPTTVLLPSYFTPTVTGIGDATVTVTGVTRDNDTTATLTLTLTYDNEDITTDGALSVAVDAAAHTGIGNLLTETIPISASTGVNICGRTPQVWDALLAAITPRPSDCTNVPMADLQSVHRLVLDAQGISILQSGDFAGLPEMTTLRLSGNPFTTLPADIFAGVTALERLFLNSTGLTTLPVGIFAGLTSLHTLVLHNNEITTLLPDLFNGLDALVVLTLDGNPDFTPGIGLPAGIFDDVLNTLGPIVTTDYTGLRVDATARAAHFVCSHLDSDAIAADAGESDCLQVSSAQFDAVVRIDARLRALTISAGTLDPVFVPATTAYTVIVPNSVDSVTVTPTAAQTIATITVNSNTVDSGSPSAAITLSPTPGMEVSIAIEVTAANGDGKKTYTLMVTRAAPPSITDIQLTSNAGDGGYAIGEAIEATVTFSEAVTVTGGPQLALTVGTQTRQAVYASGSATTALVFSYTVAAADHDADGVSIDTDALAHVDNSMIQAEADPSTDAVITHSITVVNAPEHTVDGFVPTVGGVVISSTGPYVEGEAIALTVTFDEAVTVGGTPQLPLTVGTETRQAAYTGGSGSSALVFSYTVVADDSDDDGVEVEGNTLTANGGTIQDAAGNTAALAHAAITADVAHRVDTVAPTISTATINGAALTLTYSETLDANSLPAPAAWTLTLGSGTAPTVNPGGVTINRTTVTLTLSAAVVSSDVVTLTYTAGANPLRDLAGNSATDLTTQAVNNNTPPPVAVLAGTLTEAGLFASASTPPTVTVTLTNAEYVPTAGLQLTYFTPTDTVAGDVTVTGFNRDNATTVTLTLAYDNVDITITDGTLSIAVADAAHTGSGRLPTETIPITASAGVNICDRTRQVRDALLIAINPHPSDCTNVPTTGLQEVTELNVSRQGIPALQRGDFAGLSALNILYLQENQLATLPSDIFDGLMLLTRLDLDGNHLATLPSDIFDGLDVLDHLLLFGNRFTPGTGLPAGIFDDVLDTLNPITMDGFSGFRVDHIVRAAYFVCSRDDAARIVDAYRPDVNDCLRVNSAQFNAFVRTDATLSGLTISAGSLNPAFELAGTTYTVTVPNRVDAVTVTPTASQTDATITVNTNPVDSGSASTAISLTAGTPEDIAIAVITADRSTTQTYTVTVTRAPPPGAALTGTLTEADLFTAPAPTVTVTLTNTEYVDTDDLLDHFTPTATDIGAGAVTVTGVTRNNDTTATLTLAYDNIDIIAHGTLSVTVADAAHTGIGDLNTGTIPITASAGVNICGRTPQVRDALLIAINPRPSDCTNVPTTGLRAVTDFNLSRQRIPALQRGDFAGLSGLTVLNLNGNRLANLPDGIFRGLTALVGLALGNNQLSTLPAGIFADLTNLTRLNLINNDLTILPAEIFNDLAMLENLRLFGNDFTPGIGLPVGIFDAVLDTLGPIATNGAIGLVVDENVRQAHFVCSRPDEAAIAAFAGAVDCLRVNSAQFYGYLDTRLSGLTISDGTLAPVFAPTTTNYTVTVPNSVGRVTVTPTARSGAAITVNTNPVDSGSPSADISLTAGTPEGIAIAVTATIEATVAGITTTQTYAQTYTVTVTRAPAPRVTGIGLTSNAGDGGYAIGEAIEATVTFSEAVTVTGQPQLALIVGTTTRQAVYASGSTTTALVFSYTVADDHDADGVSIGTNALAHAADGSTIRAEADPSTDAVITHSMTVVNAPEHTVDGLAPTVGGVVISSTTGPYAKGEAIALTVTFDEAVTVDGTPQLPLTVGTETRQAVYASGSSTATALVFSYTVVADDRDDDGVEVAFNALTANSGTIRDAAGNAAVLAHAAIAADVINRVDTAVPMVSTATINGDVLMLTYNEALDASSVPTPAAWTLTLGSGTAPTVNPGGVTINGATVTLMLSAAVVSADDVALTYTAGANPLRDLAGNSADDLTPQAVNNNTPPPPGAALTGTLTEAGLFAVPAPTVTVTLTNTEYVPITELRPSHFRPTDTVAGAVTVTDVTRDDDTTATLTLVYDNVDIITTDGTLFVTVADTAHTGSGDLPTGTVPISASTGANICGRTPQVRDALLAALNLRLSDCTNVPTTGLQSVGSLNLNSQGIPALQRGDFAGLTALTHLYLAGNRFTTLPAGIFNGLTALNLLELSHNPLATFAPDIFVGLTVLTELNLNGNQFTTLPAGIFDGLSKLTKLRLYGNTRLTRLPTGIFDNLTELAVLDLTNNILTRLPAGIFDNLTKLTLLHLTNTRLTRLPADIFDGLDVLAILSLDRNSLFTPGTGLPAGIFDDVLDTLKPISTRGDRGFRVDDTVRQAHFVCSRPDEAAIAAFAGAVDCLRVNSAQFYGYLDTRLSALTISDGTLAPVFAPTTTNYTVTVPNSVGRVTVTPTARSGAAITVNTNSVDSGSPSADISLTAGTPEGIAIAVTATIEATVAGITTTQTYAQTYTVTVTRAPAPRVTGIGLTSNAGDGGYAIGEAIEATVTFSEAVTVTGQPQLALIVGTTTRQAVYASGSTTTALVFSYTVADDHDADGVSIGTNALAHAADGSTIRAEADPSTDAVITHSMTVVNAPEHTVDGLAPTVGGVVISSTTGPYAKGEAIALTVTFDEAVTVVGTPQLPLTVGTETRQAVYASGSSTATALVFSYTVVAGDRDNDGFEVAFNALTANSGTIRDAAGNAAVLAHTAIAADVINRVDTAVPMVSTATINGDVLMLTYNEALDASSLPTPAAWTLTLGSGTAPTVNADGVTINGATVTLMLSAAVVSADDVALTYTAGANPLRDLAGNSADDLTPQAVNNNTPPPPGAALTGTLTEAGLFAVPAPTVTVTLTNTEYVPITELRPSHFRPTDTVAGAVTVTDVTRDDDTTATLTLVYDNVDIITTDGTLFVTVADTAHTGSGDLPTGTVPISASTGANICGRTPQVRDALLIVIMPPPSDCTNVPTTGLQSVGSLNVWDQNIPALQRGDFADLTALTVLNLGTNQLTTLPPDIFAGLTALRTLNLDNNRFDTLPPDIFAGLTALEKLYLYNNLLTTLPDGIFDGLPALDILNLAGNRFTTLPSGIFDGLSGLTVLNLNGNLLTTLPDGIFRGLTALVGLALGDNMLPTSTLPADIFADLTNLTRLNLINNDLTTLPAEIFNSLAMLENLRLYGNNFTPGSGLPAGIFDAVLDTLGPIATDGFIGLVVDENIRQAHFVCSRPDEAAIAAFVGAVDCLRVNSAQFYGYLDTRLSALTISDGTLAPVFAPTTTNYTVTVPNSVGRVTVTPTARSGAAITVNTNPVDSGSSSADISLTAGTPEGIAIAVTATIEATVAGITTTQTYAQTYTVTVTRAPAPRVTGIGLTSNAGDGGYAIGEAIEATVTFSEAVTVTGQPQLALIVGTTTRQAVYASGSTTTALVFSYTVADDHDADGVSIGTNALAHAADGSTIRAEADPSTDAVITHSMTVVNAPEHTVDGLAPTVNSVVISSTTGPYAEGEAIALTVTFDEAVMVDGTPQLPLTVGTETRQAVYASGSSTATALVFSYTVVADDRDDDGVEVAFNALTANSGTIRDAAGNAAVLAHTAIAADVTNRVDTAAPTVSTVTINGDVLTLTYNEALDASSVPTPAAWTLTLGSGTAPTVNPGGVTINGATVTLMLSAAVVSADDVALTYTAGANPLRDLAGNSADDLTPQAVNNNTPPPPVAALTGTLTEAGLFVVPAPTVTVTLTNTEYVTGLLPSHFMPTDTVAGAVTVTDVTRDNDTTATLTLVYDNVDIITTDGTLFVTVADAAHTGIGDLNTGTIPITASAGVNICGRTPQVRDTLLTTINPPPSDCTNVPTTGLQSVGSLNLSGQRIPALQRGDFAGLTALEKLNLHNNQLSILPADIFAGLTALKMLYLLNNQLSTLPAGIFDGLTALTFLNLGVNRFATLSAGIFDGFSALTFLNLGTNQLTALPPDIFAGLTGLRTLYLDTNRFDTLPPDIFAGLTALEKLYLYNNLLTTLPDGIFDGLPALDILNLAGNRFTHCPPAFLTACRG